MTKNNDTHDKTIEQKIAAFEELVQWFDSDEFVLEKAIDRYNEATRAAKEIEASLEAIENEVSVVNKS